MFVPDRERQNSIWPLTRQQLLFLIWTNVQWLCVFVLWETRTCSAVVKFISAGDKESIYEEGDRKEEGGDVGRGGWGWGAKRTLGEQMRKVARVIFQNRRTRSDSGRCHIASNLQALVALLAQQQDKQHSQSLPEKTPRKPDRRWYQQRKQHGMQGGGDNIAEHLNSEISVRWQIDIFWVSVLTLL